MTRRFVVRIGKSLTSTTFLKLLLLVSLHTPITGQKCSVNRNFHVDVIIFAMVCPCLPMTHFKGFPMSGMKLSERTLYLLQNRPKPITYAKMALDLCAIDGTITVSWLASLASERLQCKDCDKIQLVYEYLSETQLELI